LPETGESPGLVAYDPALMFWIAPVDKETVQRNNQGRSMRRSTAGFFMVLLIAALGASEAQAAPALQIRGLSCRSEWVDIRNASAQPVSLSGFRLYDGNRAHRFDFPNETLGPQGIARVWADGRSGGPYLKSWTGWGGPIFADTGDQARLVNPNGDAISTTSCPDAVAPPPPPGGNCLPNYSPCIRAGSDVDCRGGNGDGPRFVRGPITITGSDPYRLDGSDNDGIGCEGPR